MKSIVFSTKSVHHTIAEWKCWSQRSNSTRWPTISTDNDVSNGIRATSKSALHGIGPSTKFLLFRDGAFSFEIGYLTVYESTRYISLYVTQLVTMRATNCGSCDPPNHSTLVARAVRTAFVGVICCSRDIRDRGVPGDASEAVRRVRAATQAALASGIRGMLVDMLPPSLRRSSRIFDSRVHAVIVAGLVDALAPALRPNAPSVRICLPGPKAVLDIRKYFTDRAAKQAETDELVEDIARTDLDKERNDSNRYGLPLSHVEIDVLGGTCLAPENGGLVIVDPPSDINAIKDTRELVRSAANLNIPVVILNHPQPGSVHEIAECSGMLPYEISGYKTVFLLAPFAIRLADKTDGTKISDLPVSTGQTNLGRYALYYEFPGQWQLWRRQEIGEAKDTTPETVTDFLELATRQEMPGTKQGYKICQTWSQRPSEQELFGAVTRAIRKAKKKAE